MKPEKGIDDMDEGVRDPREVFIEIGFLITEARTPNFSAKGRVEGPHCPPVVVGDVEHICDKYDEECLKAEQLKKHMSHLCRNGVPMRIDVIISPVCKHGQMESSIVEGANFSTEDELILLERWDIQILPRRASDKMDGHVTARILVQAMRSYLHFSQLSSWLISTSGQLPLQIICRAYVPGESVSLSFKMLPEIHAFPHADMLHSSIMVSIAALPRREQIPVMICKSDDIAVNRESEKNKRRNLIERKKSRTCHEEGHMLSKTESHQQEKSDVDETTWEGAWCGDHFLFDSVSKQSLSQKPPIGHKANVVESILEKETVSSICSIKEFPGIESMDHFLQMKDQFPRTTNTRRTSNTRTPAPRNRFKENPLMLPESETSLEGTGRGKYGQINKRLPSPKVLFTSKPDQPVYRKRRLDFDNPAKQKAEWEPTFVDGNFKDFIKPLTSEDLETYLASLSHKIPDKSRPTGSQLDDIPSTTCKFYIGDEPDKQGYNSAALAAGRKTRDKLPVNCLFRKSLSPPESKDQQNVDKDIQFSLLKDNYSLPKALSEKQKLSNSPEAQNVQKTPSESQNHVMARTMQIEKDGYFQNGDSTSALLDIVSQRLGELEFQEETQSNFKSCDETVTEISNSICKGKPCQSSSSVKVVETLPKAATDSSLCKLVLKKELHHDLQSIDTASLLTPSQNAPSSHQMQNFRQHLGRSVSMMFNATTALPTQSSPAPVKRKSSGRFDFDSTLTSTRAIKNAISCSKLVLQSDTLFQDNAHEQKILSTSAPASTNCLLGNFEESILNGRIEPVGVVEGFTAEIGAGGSFCPKHILLPVTAYFFQLSDDNAPSPYLGHLNLEILGKKGYRIPRSGTVQVTLFNPNKTVVKMFVVMYDLNDMPPNSQTFLRQRTLYMPVDSNSSQPSYLRYLIHLRFASSRSGKVHMHTDIRLIFARDKFEFDSKTSNYELRSFTEGPQNPKFSPKR